VLNTVLQMNLRGTAFYQGCI